MELIVSLFAFWILFFIIVFLVYTAFTDQYKAARRWKMLLLIAALMSFLLHFNF